MDHPELKPQPTLKDIQEYIKAVGVYRGFDNETTQDEMLMLCEEVGELAKAIRKTLGTVRMATDSKTTEVEHELADVLWMLSCVANSLGLDLETALRQKEEHNKKRTWQ